MSEAARGGEFQDRPRGLGNREGLDATHFRQSWSQNHRKMSKMGYPPTLEFERSRNVAENKADVKKAVAGAGERWVCCL